MKSVRGILGILAMTLLLLMMPAASQKVYAAWDGTVAASFASGDGSAGNPYTIETPAQLAWLGYCVNNQSGGYGSGSYFRLDSDINLGNRDWTPIGLNNNKYFAGYFDGNGHTITQLHVSGALLGGLFGYVNGGARIQNLNVQGSVQSSLNSGGTAAGGIVGYLGDATIVNCTFYGSVNASIGSETGVGDVYAGGIVGWIGGGEHIINCTNQGGITASTQGTGHAYAGGIVGYCNVGDFTIEDCLNTGHIIANTGNTVKDFAGGILGLGMGTDNDHSVDITRCLNTGSFESWATHKEPITWIGDDALRSGIDNNGKVGIYDDCYYQGTGGLTSEEWATQSTFEGYNFETTWKMTTTGPVLRAATAADPRLVKTWTNLYKALQLGGYTKVAEEDVYNDRGEWDHRIYPRYGENGDEDLSVPVGVCTTLDLDGCWVYRLRWDDDGTAINGVTPADNGSVIEAYGILDITAYDGFGSIRGGWDGASQEGKGGGIYVHSGAAVSFETGMICNNMATTAGGGVYVDNGGVFRLLSGDIIGNMSGGKGAGVYVASGGVFEMLGGCIQDNEVNGNGGGVYVEDGGRFIMTDGEFFINSATFTSTRTGGNGGGVYLEENAIFEMSGGSISENTAEGKGNAVYVTPGSTFEVSDSFAIGDDTVEDDEENAEEEELQDVYLPTGAVITIGELDRVEPPLCLCHVSVENLGVFTDGWTTSMGNADPADYFYRIYDRNGSTNNANGEPYDIGMTGGELTVVPHRLVYTVNGATITATYHNAGCLWVEGGTVALTLLVPRHTIAGDSFNPAASLRQTGEFFAAVGMDAEDAVIHYVGVNGTNYPDSTTPPTAAGSYTASVSACGKTASVTYTISGDYMRVTARGATGAYTGIPRTITVNVLTPSEGATIMYGTTEGTYDLTENPGYTEVGTHTTYFKVSAEGYADYTGSATVTIRKAGIPITGFTAPTAKKLYYTGEAQELATAGSSNVGTLVYAPGTADEATGEYSATIPTATEAGTYYVWFRVYGDSNHLDSAEFKLAVTISAEAPDPDPDDDPVDDGQVSSFVTRMYEVFLDRTPDEEEVTFWTTLLDQGTQTAGEAAAGFIFSTEFSNRNMCNSHFLDYLYLGLFGRPADEEGKAGWLLLMDEGYSREMVAQGFLTSTEFYDLCDRYEVYAGRGMATVPKLGTIQKAHCTIEGCTVESPVRVMVVNLYDTVFGRVPSEEEVEFWVEIMASHNPDAPARVMVNTFLNGDEYATLDRDNGEYVTDLYMAIFGREPDEAGYNEWLSALENGTLTREGVLDMFIGSPEFIDQCHHAGIAVGIGDQ